MIAMTSAASSTPSTVEAMPSARRTCSSPCGDGEARQARHSFAGSGASRSFSMSGKMRALQINGRPLGSTLSNGSPSVGIRAPAAWSRTRKDPCASVSDGARSRVRRLNTGVSHQLTTWPRKARRSRVRLPQKTVGPCRRHPVGSADAETHLHWTNRLTAYVRRRAVGKARHRRHHERHWAMKAWLAEQYRRLHDPTASKTPFREEDPGGITPAKPRNEKEGKA